MHEHDSKFYRKFKPELPLSNPTTTYNKHRKRLLDCWDACEKLKHYAYEEENN